MNMIKKIKSKEDFYIEFSDEELEQLDMKKGDKFSWKLNDDGSVTMEKHKEIELDLDEFSKEDLINLILHSREHDCTIEESITILLEKSLEQK